VVPKAHGNGITTEMLGLTHLKAQHFVERHVGSYPGLELGEVGEAVAVEVLVLEDGPEALGTGVVIGLTG
jgi:hypothetical protein